MKVRKFYGRLRAPYVIYFTAAEAQELRDVAGEASTDIQILSSLWHELHRFFPERGRPHRKIIWKHKRS